MAAAGSEVTLFFSDIVGSTRLWEEDSEAMRRAVARHDALAVAAIQGHSGRLVKHLGDGIFAAFARPEDALAAALSYQFSLLVEAWPTLRPLEARLALHTGRAEFRDGDYFGPAVNRCSRLEALGHGGQILLSAEVARRTAVSLPASTQLLDLGVHRLRDLTQAEQVFQLCHPELPSQFPALRSADSFPNNLPVQVTSFLGREREVAALKELTADQRCVTLVGAAGCGKTRLALQVASEVLHRYPEGVWLTELACVETSVEAATDAASALAASAIAAALGVRERAGEPLLRTLVEHLSERRALLVVDNCEHLTESVARALEEILRRCPHIGILATSRERLGILGERVWPVPCLACPSEAPESIGALLAECEAARLFLDRALAVRPDFSPTDADVEALITLCRRLDGIPLALELAAARVNALSVGQIAARLDDRFRLLTRGSRTALPRQRTLSAAFEWSYELLSPVERRLLARLSVFHGGVELEAVEAVCSGGEIDAIEVLDLVSALVDRSLVMAVERRGAIVYRLLESLREFAAGKLAALEDTPETARRHAIHFAEVGDRAVGVAKGQTGDVIAESIAADLENLQRAVRWAVAQEEAEVALRCCSGLWRYLRREGRLSDGAQLLESALTASRGRVSLSRGETLRGAAALAFDKGDLGAAGALWEEALSVSEALGDTWGAAAALGNLANLAGMSGEYDRAEELYARCRATMLALGDQRGAATALLNQAYLAHQRHDGPRAAELCEESVRAMRSLGYEAGVAHALGLLGSVLRETGAGGRAIVVYEEAVEAAASAGDRRTRARLLASLSEADLAEGDLARAEATARESLAVRRDIGDVRGAALSLRALSAVALARGEVAEALALAREGLRAAIPPADIGALLDVYGQAAKAEGRDALADRCRRAAQALSTEPGKPEGRAMSAEEALALAREIGTGGP